MFTRELLFALSGCKYVLKLRGGGSRGGRKVAVCDSCIICRLCAAFAASWRGEHAEHNIFKTNVFYVAEISQSVNKQPPPPPPERVGVL